MLWNYFFIEPRRTAETASGHRVERPDFASYAGDQIVVGCTRCDSTAGVRRIDTNVGGEIGHAVGAKMLTFGHDHQ